eukprot:CAMPEP_0119423306 /NCGR_PEP_ID=MMETSP1335-20130426/29990_1 /TAXON_ID=259385 /ORGANISM="Chrysoculter rhomboideus, Strain RCC1486" /LENGTH=292 /DNA_ID=CAMNT_0007448791 /DNA_START=290 /DNA_END=1167 /DNA_ORIENTATION=+
MAGSAAATSSAAHVKADVSRLAPERVRAAQVHVALVTQRPCARVAGKADGARRLRQREVERRHVVVAREDLGERCAWPREGEVDVLRPVRRDDHVLGGNPRGLLRKGPAVEERLRVRGVRQLASHARRNRVLVHKRAARARAREQPDVQRVVIRRPHTRRHFGVALVQAGTELVRVGLAREPKHLVPCPACSGTVDQPAVHRASRAVPPARRHNGRAHELEEVLWPLAGAELQAVVQQDDGVQAGKLREKGPAWQQVLSRVREVAVEQRVHVVLVDGAHSPLGLAQRLRRAD